MAKIIIELSESILTMALQEAQERECTIDEYIADTILKDLDIETPKKVAINMSEIVEDALEAAATKPIGAEFMLVDICSKEVWANLDNGDKKAFGRAFKKAVDAQIPKSIVFDRRSTGNKAIYRKSIL